MASDILLRLEASDFEGLAVLQACGERKRTRSATIRDLIPSPLVAKAICSWRQNVGAGVTRRGREIQGWITDLVKELLCYEMKTSSIIPNAPFYLHVNTVDQPPDAGERVAELYLKFQEALYSVKGYRFEVRDFTVPGRHKIPDRKQTYAIILGPGDDVDSIQAEMVEFLNKDKL